MVTWPFATNISFVVFFYLMFWQEKSCSLGWLKAFKTKKGETCLECDERGTRNTEAG